MDIHELPNPDKLAKQARLGTTQVSLRVKDRTYDVFARYANLYKTTPGGMINSLLDAYASNIYEKEQAEIINKEEFSRYMSSALKKLAKMNDENLFLVSAHRMEFEDEVDRMRELYRIISRQLEGGKKEKTKEAKDHLTSPYQLLHFENLHRMFPTTSNKASIKKNGAYSNHYTLFVPIKFWFFISAFLALYAREYKEFSHGYELIAVLSEQFLNVVVSSINSSKSTPELANKLEKLFR